MILSTTHLVDCLGRAVTSIGPSVTSLQVPILDLSKICFKHIILPTRVYAAYSQVPQPTDPKKVLAGVWRL